MPTASRAQPPQQVATNQQEHSFSRQAQVTFSGTYLLYLPEHYEEDTKRQWPVLLYLHSSDARGSQVKKLEQEGLPSYLRAGTHIPFIVVAPLCPAEEWWDSHWMVENSNALLDEVLTNYRVDKSRVYLTGWSMGGAGTWSFASAHADRFAAIAPISGRTQLKYAVQLHDTPVWAFHGEKDTIVPLSESQKMVDELKSEGGSARLTILKDAGHEAWPLVYGDPKFYDWLLGYANRNTPTR